MAFLAQGSGPTIFFEIGDESKKKLFRPLVSKPICIWGHSFPTPETAAQMPDGKIEKIRLRDYTFIACTAIDRKGTGCGVCNSTDPGWQYLTQKDQTNKKGHRVDFPKRPVYLLPIWSYTDNAIKVLRGGTQVYEEMDNWDTAGRDIRECDWLAWKKQLGQNRMQVEYKTQRMDSTTFDKPQGEDAVKTAMAEALKEYAPPDMQKLPQLMAVMEPQEAINKFLEAKSRTAQGAALPPAFGAPQLPPGPFSSPPPPPAQLPPAAPQLPITGQLPQTGGYVPTTTTGPAPQVSAAPPDMAALMAGLTPEQMRMMATLLQAQQNTGVTPGPVGASAPPPGVAGSAPLAQTATGNNPVAGFKDLQGVSANPQVPVQTGPTPAPAQPAPVVAPPALTATSPSKSPHILAEYVLESGKYKGSKLVEVAAKDPAYLKFFRSTQSEDIKALITSALENKPEMPAPAPQAAPPPAPTAPPVATSTGMAQPPLPAPAPQDDRLALVAECKGLISKIPEFQGRGMGDNMIPWLRSVSGGKFDYTEWTVELLTKLKGALIARLGGNAPTDVQMAAN